MSANATPQSPAIQTRDLTRKYGRVTAINSLNITIEAGEKVVLVGPNGSGKTTLIKLLSTLIKPTSGDLFIHGYDVAKHDVSYQVDNWRRPPRAPPLRPAHRRRKPTLLRKNVPRS